MKTHAWTMGMSMVSVVLLSLLLSAGAPPAAAQAGPTPTAEPARSDDSQGEGQRERDLLSGARDAQPRALRTATAIGAGGTTTRVSVASAGTQADGTSDRPVISSDGRYVVFRSIAANLVSGDTNGTWDVFVHDRQTGQTTRVNVASDGTQGDEDAGYYGTSISADGRYVAFESRSSRLVTGDTNGWHDIFVHDRQKGQTVRVSVDSGGTEGNSNSMTPSLSADGRYVAFSSEANHLVSGDTNGHRDIFLRRPAPRRCRSPAR